MKTFAPSAVLCAQCHNVSVLPSLPPTYKFMSRLLRLFEMFHCKRWSSRFNHHHHRPPVRPQNNSHSNSPLVVVDNNKSRRIDSPPSRSSFELRANISNPSFQCSQRSPCHCCNKLHKQASTQVAITQSFSGTLVLITINRPPMRLGRLFSMHKVC